MKTGEKLRYKARRYLYQLEQSVSVSAKRKQAQMHNEPVEHEKSYYKPQETNYDYYDIYSDYNPKYGQYDHYDPDDYYKQKVSFDEYYSKNEYMSPKKYKNKNNNKIIGALDELEEYLEEKMEKFKK